MDEIDLNDLLDTAVEAARAGGKVLQEWSNRFSVSEKSCASDVVTEADHESQRVIHEIIHSRYPNHGFLGEEGMNTPPKECAYRWVVDPLDGTSNYVHRFPYYAVSIAVENAGKLIAGVIHDPNRDELYSASLGKGAWCNGRRLSVSHVPAMKQALLVASFPPGSHSGTPAIQQFLKILPQVQTIQRTGSAAMNLANLAAGRIDGFWSFSLKPWDLAAGVLLVREAGGIVTKVDGSQLDIEVPDMVASNGSGLHESLLKALLA